MALKTKAKVGLVEEKPLPSRETGTQTPSKDSQSPRAYPYTISRLWVFTEP